MKKTLLIWIGLSFFFLTAKAQTFTQTIDSLLIHVSKSPITTGILYDRAFPNTALHLFNRNESDTAFNSYFKSAYLEMLTAAYNPVGWISTDSLNTCVYNIAKNGQVPVGFSFYNYDVIDTNALANNLIQMHSDSLYYDTPGRTSSPFDILNTFVASPLLDSVSATISSTVTYSFPANLIINNSGLTISSLKGDFSDGNGLVALTPGSTHTVNYNANGYQTIKFVVVMSNNITYTTYGKIKVINTRGEVTNVSSNAATTTCSLVRDYPNIFTGLPFKGYDESSPSSAVGSIEVNYATTGACDGVVRKPILIVDSFDINPYTLPSDIYAAYNTINPTNGLRFLDNLRSQGYDIITLSYQSQYINGSVRTGGTDYIERNGLMVAQAIQYINGTLKQGTAKMTLMGPSMGGLVTQYALRYMEQNHILHNVSLWIAFDSPFLGANVPIGDQQWVNYYATNANGGKDALNKYANVPAAKEMLINHYLANASGPGGAPGFRDRFSTMMSTLGFPVGDPGQPLRKIAVVDGSLGGNELNTDCGQIFTSKVQAVAHIKLWFFKVKLKGITVASAQANFTPNAGSTCTVLHASLLFNSKSINFTTPSTTSGYDTAPGGYYNFTQFIAQQGSYYIWVAGFLPLQSSFSSVINNHSFVSTKSALAFKGTDVNLSENISGRNLVCTQETPFDSYFGSLTTNQSHVTLWSNAMTWLNQEINGVPQQPSVTPQSTSYTIAGPASFCSSGSYSVTGLPAAATVAWSATPASLVTLTTSGKTVTVTQVGSGDVTLNAAVTYNCQLTNATPFALHVGGPNVPVISAYIDYVNGIPVMQYTTASVTGVTYKWTINGAVQSSTTSICNVSEPPCQGGNPFYYNAQVTETNSCGSSANCEQWRYACSPLSFTANAPCTVTNSVMANDAMIAASTNSTSSVDIAYYPNPCNEQVTLSSKAFGISTFGSPGSSSLTPYSYTLYNQKGKILKKGTSDGNDITLNVSNLQNDIYILHVNINSKTVEKKLFVKH